MGNMDEAREQRMRAQLEAIEARLREHPQVVGAAAAVRDDRLIAYVVSFTDQVVDEEALRGHLKTTLPAYMVPRHFVALASLPLAPDGSVDRDALPETRSLAPVAHAAPAEARDGAESRIAYLAGIWSQLLAREVGPDDNFFDIGGHSMLAVQMANRVKADTGVRIQLMTLASQTLAQIAAELPTIAKPASRGLGSRLFGMLRGAGAAGQP